MKMQVMAIFDKALGAYMRPWFAQAIGQATRMFQDELANTQGDMHKHPEDYNLYHLGEWDDQQGTFENYTGGSPKLVITGANLKGGNNA